MNNYTNEPNEIRIITPEIAKEWLTFNTHNRDFKGSYQRIVLALRNGEWEYNGEAIKWHGKESDDNKVLLDGQNRLLAIVNTGISMKTAVAWGLPYSTQETMDVGDSRNLADMLKIRGEKSTTLLAAITRRIFLYKTHSLRSSTSTSYPTTNLECLRELDRNPSIRDLLPLGRKVRAGAKLNASLAAVLYYAFSAIDAEDADGFFDTLISGEMIAAGHPIYALRSVLNKFDEESGTKNQTHIAALVIKSWNKYRAGENISLLSYRPGGANPEAFPEPK